MMPYEAILDVLRYAGDNDLPVAVTLRGEPHHVSGVPTSVDDHLTAHECYLRVGSGDTTEIAISLAEVESVSLLLQA